MIEQTFHTPLPLTLEVSIPSGDIDVDTGNGEETNVTVDGDERMLEHVEVRHDGNRVSVTLRDKSKLSSRSRSARSSSATAGSASKRGYRTAPA